MCRISAISDDWIVKGCHLHVSKVEIALRPDHMGGIVFRKVSSTTADWEIEIASKAVMKALEDPKWRRKLRDRLTVAMTHLLGEEGDLRDKARSRLAEFHRLILALERLEWS